MDEEQLPLAPSMLGTMRVAVKYARDAGSAFVATHHILLALLDDEVVGPPLRENLDRDRVLAAEDEPRLPHVLEIAEAPDAPADISPLKRYDTLAFRTPDGLETMWLDRHAYKVFLEGARRADLGPFAAKHLALGLLSEAVKDRDIRKLLGSDPGPVSAAVLAL